jgi:putative DNA primase/helicase
MTTFINYDGVLEQLRSIGLVVDSLDVGTPRPRRVKVEGERERRGWYWLHEFRLDSGEYALVGTFGVWHGLEPNTQKIKLKNTILSDEQKKAIKARIAADRKRGDTLREREAAKASARAAAMWKKLAGGEDLVADYLEKKEIGAHGTRSTPDGTLVVPMMDRGGQVHGLQFIGPKVRAKLKNTDKQFWPYGMNPIGRHLILDPDRDPWLILIAEGYATAATLRDCTPYYAVDAFTAGNLLPVAQELRKRYRQAKILFCADDDFASRGNPGVSAASLAATAVDGAWVAPVFPPNPLREDIVAAKEEIDKLDAKQYKQRVEEIRRGRPKLTDFNDLAVHATPQTVTAQIEAKLLQLKWARGDSQGQKQKQGERGDDLKSITSVQEVFDRYAIVYGHNKALFDFQEHILISIEDMKNACAGREIWRPWMESPTKKIVRIKNVGFDPGGEDPEITCNLWGGFPSEPVKGKCDNLLGLLEYMCTHEDNHHDLNRWVLRWLAYPIRYPGAKMKSALVFHGWQGVGKNLFFEVVMGLYGEYGRVIDQSSLEDKHNDTFSKKLFFIADEVIARQELYHVKGKLKGLITGDWIRINPKNISHYFERNHANFVFLSNEILPIILDRDDRRFFIIWTPKQLRDQFYKDVRAEIEEGGIAALHYYLKHDLDMGDFNTWSHPPMTQAKLDLIEVSMDSTERFWIEWTKERIEHVPAIPAKSTRLYAFYREWCGRTGYARYAPEPKFLAEIARRSDGKKKQARYMNGAAAPRLATFIFPPGVAAPADKTEQAWLGECVQQFDFSVTEWREEEKTDR